MSAIPASSSSTALSGTNATPSTTATPSPITISGLASGLNTSQIIQGMLALDQQKVTNLTNQESQVTTQQTSFSQLEAQLLSLQSSLGTLTGPQNAFSARTAAPSDSSVLTAAASSSAVPGIYNLTVNSLAQAEQVASQGFASTTSTITQGSFQIGQASGQAATINIDNSNDTLQGLADAINNANVGVSASIVNDGSAQPYRLLLTSDTSGTANAIAINNNLAADNNGAVQPLFNTTVQQATDASVTLGGGSAAGSGLTVTSSSNQLNNLIQGVTLSLESTSNAPLTLTVAADTTQASQALQSFVQPYHSLITTINQDTTYDAGSGTAGPLLGNIDVSNIEDEVRSDVENSVGGVNPLLNQLGALGITVGSDGTLNLDQTQLNNVLSGSVSGVTLNDVENFFTLSGTSSSPNVQFLTGSDQTQSSTTPYQVQVTQAATQALLTAVGTLQASTNIDSSNDTFTINVDGQQSSTITLADNPNYTPQQLAQALQTAINNAFSSSGRQVAVGLVNGNQLAITSASYGSASSVSVGPETAALDALGLTGSSPAQGQDVQGSFLVNNVAEPATGQGQILTGNSSNANTAGLAVLSTLTSAQITNTPEASVTVTEGIAAQLSNTLQSLLDPTTGRLATINQGYQDELTQLQQEVTAQNQLIAAKQTALTNEFANMEETIAQLQSTSSFLSNQFAALLNSGSQSQQSSSSSQKGVLNG